MKKKRSLSKGEMEVARVLWEIGPASVRQVHEALSTTRKMDFATVQTYLRRLETKEYATSQLEGRSRIYSAKAKPRTVIRDTVKDLVNRLFGGRSMVLVRHLIEDGEIAPQDIAELRRLVDELESQQAAKDLDVEDRGT